ncbi:MAG: type III secretion system gatekeeper subunit SctW [Victivallales bacterium]|nr:type III secretion system gatekeeper subunit SctW [Victivallales bacterium]
MPLDLAQFLRNSVAIDRYDSVRTGSLAEKGAEGAQAAGETGVLMGTVFEVEADPMAELLDSMEELTFMFEEKEMKSIGERRLGGANRSMSQAFVQALNTWMKAFPDMPGERFVRSMLAMLHQAKDSGRMPTARDLLNSLAEGSKDASHQFAMLDILEQAMAEGGADRDGAFRTLIESARQMLMSEQGEAVRAGINLAQEVNARATSPEEMQDLRDMYRGEILGFSTPQQCFRSIMGTRGAAGLQAAIEFLTAGCGADLQSATPSKSPEELRRIILDLQCVQVLKTVLDRMGALGERMATQYQQPCRMDGQAMTGKIMDFTELSYVSAGEIGGFIGECGVETLLARMDFCRELTAVFRQLSSRLFSSEQDRINLVAAAQEHLDGIVEEEYDQEEGDDDGKEGGK